MSAQAKRWIAGSILALSALIAAVYAYFYSYHLASFGLFVSAFAVTCMSLIYILALGFSLWWHRMDSHSATSH